MMESIQSTFGFKFFCAIAPFILLYVALKKTIFSYWQKHGVPHEDFAIPAGIIGFDFFTSKMSISDVIKKSYDKYKKYPFHGVYMFHNKILMVNDVELIKNILTKDFNHFCGRGFYSNHKADPMTENLVFLSGNNKWKSIRAKLSPSLTTGKMKHLFPIMREIAAEMIRIIEYDLTKTNVLDMKDLTSRYITDSAYNLVFGVDSRCLREPRNDFLYYGNLLFTENVTYFTMAFFAPEILEFLKIRIIRRNISKFFTGLFECMVDKRRKEHPRRDDTLDSLIRLMDNEKIIDTSTIDSDFPSGENSSGRLEPTDALPQAFVLFIAAIDTNSSLIPHWLYELALNPDVQAKVHEEIDALLVNPDSFTYENLMQLQYLDMTFQESLRKHSPLAFLNRICVKDYPIPDSDFVIQKGTRIVISVSGIHSNPDFYPEPEKFDPTRFTKENVASRHQFSYMPFGKGPRYCIGQRLGTLVSKLAIFMMLANYKLSVCERTPIPNYYSPATFVQRPRDDIYLKVERRRNLVF